MKNGKYESWEIESDARTIAEAQKLRADKKKWPKIKIELAKLAAAAQRAALEAGVKVKLKGLVK